MAGTQSDMGFGALRATTSIVNVHSSGGTSSGGLNSSSMGSARVIFSGALTAGVLATLIDVPSGAGELPLLAVAAQDGTARTVRLKVTVDGLVVFDATSNSVSAAGSGVYAAGAFTATGVFAPANPIVFTRSCKVEIASSLTETDKLFLGYQLHRK